MTRGTGVGQLAAVPALSQSRDQLPSAAMASSLTSL
jgi:hypothetical protein